MSADTTQRWPIPESWRWATMSDVAEVIGGGTPDSKRPEYWEGDVAWITPADLSGYTSKTIARGARSITQSGLSNSGARVLPAGTVLMSSRAPVGYIAIASGPLSTNQGFKSFVLRDGLLPDYVYWFLKGNTELLREYASGTTFAEVSGRRAAEVPIPVAPVAEQRRIVAALEEHLSDLDAAVAGLERARANLRRLRAATTRAAVDGSLLPNAALNGRAPGPDPWAPAVPASWSWATVEDVAEIVEYGTSAKTREDADGVPVLRMGNIVDGALSWDALKYLPASHDEFPRLMLRAGDVLFNRTNSPELVGKTAVYGAGSPPASFASYLLRVRLKSHLHPEIFSAYLNSTYGRAWVATVVSQQVGQANVNGTKLRALRVPVPPEDEQLALVAELERRLGAAERAVADIDVQLTRASRLRQSIVQRAFSGRLVPQNPADEPASVLLLRAQSPAPSAHRRPRLDRC